MRLLFIIFIHGFGILIHFTRCLWIDRRHFFHSTIVDVHHFFTQPLLLLCAFCCSSKTAFYCYLMYICFPLNDCVAVGVVFVCVRERECNSSFFPYHSCEWHVTYPFEMLLFAAPSFSSIDTSHHHWLQYHFAKWIFSTNTQLLPCNSIGDGMQVVGVSLFCWI